MAAKKKGVSTASIGKEIRKKQQELRRHMRGADKKKKAAIALHIKHLDKIHKSLLSACKGAWSVG